MRSALAHFMILIIAFSAEVMASSVSFADANHFFPHESHSEEPVPPLISVNLPNQD